MEFNDNFIRFLQVHCWNGFANSTPAESLRVVVLEGIKATHTETIFIWIEKVTLLVINDPLIQLIFSLFIFFPLIAYFFNLCVFAYLKNLGLVFEKKGGLNVLG